MTAGDEQALTIILGIVAVVYLAVYFVPTMVARRRRHQHTHAIFWINLLLGWSLFGWIGALLWAINNDVKPLRRRRGEAGESSSPVLASSPLRAEQATAWGPVSGLVAPSTATTKTCGGCSAEAIPPSFGFCPQCGAKLG